MTPTGQWLTIYHSPAAQGHTPKGACLVESFAKFKSANGPVYYMPELLDNLYHQTGVPVMAICSDGATLVNNGSVYPATFT